MVQHGLIDVHHHNIPPAFVKVMADKGIKKVAGAPLPVWTPEKSIDVMDSNGIQTSITSLSAPGVHFGDGVKQAQTLARQCNDFSAEMVAKYPKRFGSFAVLPMPFTEASCTEAVYALDTLESDGVVLLGSTDGKFLGDDSYIELMAELNQREAVVFVHPNIHSSSESLGLNIPGFFLEFLCDTTRAALNLILTGTIEMYPKIKWLLAHSGGFLPYIAWRVSLANMLPKFAENVPQGILHYIKKFYYDTALSPSRYSLVVLKELVDPSHILFGSDFPFAPVPLVSLESKTLSEVDLWTEKEQYGINRGNALGLFPKYCEPQEVITSIPTFFKESLSNKFRRFGSKIGVQVVSLLQNR